MLEMKGHMDQSIQIQGLWRQTMAWIVDCDDVYYDHLVVERENRFVVVDAILLVCDECPRRVQVSVWSESLDGLHFEHVPPWVLFGWILQLVQ